MESRNAKRPFIATFVIAITFAVAVCVPPAADPGFPAGLPIERVNLGAGGIEANGASADGRYVAFISEASNLVTGDTNLRWDVFVHDRLIDSVERVSVNSGGVEADSDSHTPSLSGDGRYVAFSSDATNLVPGDTNGLTDIFVYDRHTDAVERVSVGLSGAEADASSYGSVMSANGRYVAFYSRASNLVAADTNGTVDIFVRDRQNGTTERVSVSTGGVQANSMSFGGPGSISADGRFVAFYSSASNLVADDTNGAIDVFVRDRQAGTTERVSVDGSGAQADGPSAFPSLSGDGRFVAFESDATNLVAGDGNSATDVFLYDRTADTVPRLSVSAAGTEGNGASLRAALSADGRYAIFRSDAANLVTADTNGKTDIFAAPVP